MARKSSSDRIATDADNMARLEEIAEYQMTHKDPRKKYNVSYDLNCASNRCSEIILAETQQKAIEILNYNCSLVGWHPTNIEVVEQEQ